MFDFLSFVRDTGVEVKILPPGKGVLIRLEVREAEHGFTIKRDITDKEAASCGNIDEYTGRILDGMVKKIREKKEREYAARHASVKRQELETFWKQSNPSKLTEEK